MFPFRTILPSWPCRVPASPFAATGPSTGRSWSAPYADPNQVEAEAWAELRRRCAHLDRAKLTPLRQFSPYGGLVLKVISTDTQFPVPDAVASIHSLLVQVDSDEGG